MHTKVFIQLPFHRFSFAFQTSFNQKRKYIDILWISTIKKQESKLVKDIRDFKKKLFYLMFYIDQTKCWWPMWCVCVWKYGKHSYFQYILLLSYVVVMFSQRHHHHLSLTNIEKCIKQTYIPSFSFYGYVSYTIYNF